MNALSNQGGHSAQVKMRLIVKGASIRISSSHFDKYVVPASAGHHVKTG